MDLEPVWHVDVEARVTVWLSKGTVHETSNSHFSSKKNPHVVVGTRVLDTRALGGDELVASLVHHTHAHLALVSLLAKAPGSTVVSFNKGDKIHLVI